MYEVEVKVPTPHEPVRRRLRELGAERLGTVHQRDVYYDHPSRSFAETDEALRLRREDDGGTTVTLTYKGPLVDEVSKTREEVETEVADADAMDDVLRAVGFEPAAEVAELPVNAVQGPQHVGADIGYSHELITGVKDAWWEG